MHVKSIVECSNGEHSAIRSTFIKLPLSIKTFVCLFISGRSRQVLMYSYIATRAIILIHGTSGSMVRGIFY